MPRVVFVGGLVETLNVKGRFGAYSLLHPSVLVGTYGSAAVSIGALEDGFHAQRIGNPVVSVA